MKYMRYLFCICFMLPLKGVIPPAISGSLQELHNKIEKGQIQPLEAQKTFKTLTERLLPDDLKNSLVTYVIETARQKNILLSFGETKEPITTKETPTSAKQQPVTQELTPKQLDTIKMAIKELAKVYKREKPETITKALDLIKSKIGTTQVPKNVTAALQQLEQFKNQLVDDLAFINTLGNELTEERKTITITNPKDIKKLIEKTNQIHHDIKELEAQYPDNPYIADAAHTAHKNSTLLLYDIMQESMAKAAQLKDRVLVRKLVRAYAHVVDAFPLFSEKRLAKEALVKQLAESKAQLLTLFEEYTKLDPALVEQRVAVFEPVEYLLDDDDLLMLDTMHKYLTATYDHLAILADIESTIKDVKKELRDNPNDLSIIDRNLDIIPAALFDTTEISTMQKRLGGQWLASKVEPLANELSTLIAELTKLKKQKVTQSLENIDKLIAEFDIPSISITEKPTEYIETVITPALDLKPVSTTAKEKILKESEQREIERIQQQTAKIERQIALITETEDMLKNAVERFKKRRSERELKDFREAVAENIKLITDKVTQERLKRDFQLINHEITTLQLEKAGGS